MYWLLKMSKCMLKRVMRKERESSVCLIKRETTYNEKRVCVLIKRYCVGWKEWEREWERECVKELSWRVGIEHASDLERKKEFCLIPVSWLASVYISH
jgi:hypothetical protein